MQTPAPARRRARPGCVQDLLDDTNTLSVGWFFDRVPNEMEPFTQDRIPFWYGPITDPRTGRSITTHIMNQDFVAWTGQGAIADRTREHLGESDRGVILIRKRLLEEAEVESPR